ncbi:MAG: hypothetical protein M1821_002492 [Bathelium mastoideum]|nr:MAG: hypothetical protein M1821_002492 [Bathelium mastoideum]
MANPTITEVHFVGSVCLSDTPTVFRRLATSFSAKALRTIPDGEPGKRHNFVIFQTEVFSKSPFVLLNSDFTPNTSVEPGPDAPPIELLPVQYDDFAIASYKSFCQLRDTGVIKDGVRFQVSLPTPVNVLGNLITPAWRTKVEPVYAEALKNAIKRIQNNIPAGDLAIQFDMAGEFAYLEDATHTPPWFSPLKEGLVERVLEMVACVDKDVELGFHFCYGDLGHVHFTQPKDLAVVVEFANMLLDKVERPVSWIHMPVPKARTDPQYFEALRDLRTSSKLFLGLVHMNDYEGTEARLKSAGAYVPNLGIATECGLGRASKDELDSVISISQSIIAKQR